MQKWQLFHRSQLMMALASGLLLTLSFPNFDQGWLAWCALVPLMLALRSADGRSGFWLGFAAGMMHFLTLVYWTAYTMHTYGHLPWFQSVLLLVLLSAYLALFPALFGMAVARLSTRPGAMVLAAPAIWTALEFLRTWLFTGFPWELLGYSQYDHLWVIQVSDLLGVYGISALIVLINCALTLGILHWLEKPWQTRLIPTSTLVKTVSAAVGAFLITLCYGIYRVGHIDDASTKAPKANISVIQGNIDQAVKWDPKFQVLTTSTYRKLSMKAAKQDTDLIIWPETATPFYFLHDQNLSRIVIDTIQTANTNFIVGSPSFVSNSDTYNYHNSAYMVTAQGRSSEKYDKVHLVPFGEYVPLKRWLPFIKKMVAQVGDFKSGASGNTLQWQQHRVGMQICYEVIFPSLARAMARNDAHLLVNITNDAWFGRTSAAYQHYSMSVFRAVENRRWLARAANTGISGFIDPCGRVVQATPIYEEATATAQVALLKQKSFYTRWGDWPLILLTFGIPVVIIGRSIHQRSKTR